MTAWWRPSTHLAKSAPTVRDTAVHLLEETDYPFREVSASRESGIAAQLPVYDSESQPGPATPAILVNGQRSMPRMTMDSRKIERTWKAGDVVELRFPMLPRVSRGLTTPSPLRGVPWSSHFPLARAG